MRAGGYPLPEARVLVHESRWMAGSEMLGVSAVDPAGYNVRLTAAR